MIAVNALVHPFSATRSFGATLWGKRIFEGGVSRAPLIGRLSASCSSVLHEEGNDVVAVVFPA